MQNLSFENEFYTQFHFHANQSHFHKNGFALSLALKQRQKGTRQWPIGMRFGGSQPDFKIEKQSLKKLFRSNCLKVKK